MTTSNKSGFTLLELLIVILIIGLLSAISIPMYKKAVEKSKVADALSTMQAVSKSEHGWYLVRNNYTKDFANLDIDLYDKDGNKAEDESFDSINYTFTLQDNAIKAERNNNEYTLYKLYEDGNIYCSPQDHYICQQYDWAMNQQACKNLGAAWSNWKNKCFNTEGERCVAHEMTYNENTGVCGCSSTKNGGCSNVTINEGGQCIGKNYNTCSSTTINQGGVCAGICQYSTFTGGLCTNSGGGTCSYSTFTAGSTCDATGPGGGACSGNYFEASTCLGTQYSGCRYSTFTAGSICSASGDSLACNDSTFSSSTCEGIAKQSCKNSTFEEGSVCISNNAACSGITKRAYFRTGSKCIAQNGGCAGAVFENNTVCEGNSDSSCGANGYRNQFQSGSKCIGGATYACVWADFSSGSICVANASNACGDIGYGHKPTFSEGSICQGEASGGCSNLKNMQGICEANKPGACANNTYTGNGCCSGQYCPEGAKLCAA